MRRRISATRADLRSDEAMINLTPLIDVVFVMLIMFIVVAPLMELDQVELAQGGVNAKELSTSASESSPITIHVRATNDILLNHERVTLIELKRRLRNEKRIHPKAIPLLFHDKKAFFGTYQEVKNALEEAGFHEMDVILAP